MEVAAPMGTFCALPDSQAHDERNVMKKTMLKLGLLLGLAIPAVALAAPAALSAVGCGWSWCPFCP
jgi:hypothetical protein